MASNFYTPKGYERMKQEELTSTMEDYLEMITRLSNKQEIIRIKDLSEELHVATSSASKMAENLKKLDYIHFEKYGFITLTEKGRQTGTYLMHRHEIVQKFLCWLNGTTEELLETEKLEHSFSKRTIFNLERLLEEQRKK